MEYEIRLSAQALADASEVVERIASAYVRMAARWFTGLLKSIDSLRVFPERCPLAPEADAFQREIRQLFYGKRRKRYRILFVVEADTVHILRILHGARDSLRP
jgi:plasmid stabilization system protein ParE